MRLAIILFNLGGPDGQDSVRPFLFNLFNDPSILRLPALLRTPLAYLIAARRAPLARENYALMGGGSPLLPNTEAQARALEAQLRDIGDVRCFTCMRYWQPMSDDIAAQVRDYAPDKIILLPLYPQYSTTTSASSLRVWKRAARRAGLKDSGKLICCYPQLDGFIASMARAIRPIYAAAENYGKPRVLFSAHGLPEKIVASGDPYQWQCERTVEALVRALNIPDLDWVGCYQSRVGPLRWIGPATEDEVARAGAARAPIVMVPMAFVSEHVETLVELDHEYGLKAQACGAPFYGRAQTAGTSQEFIEGLARLVRDALSRDDDKILAPALRCPENFSGCACRGENESGCGI